MKVCILGTGGWGLTLGRLLHANEHQVVFWTHSSKEAEMLAREQEYPDKLPGIRLPAAFRYFTHMPSALSGCGLVLSVVPSQHLPAVAKQLGAWTPPDAKPLVVNASKGITEDGLLRMSEVLLQNVPWLDDSLVVTLSGPSHAEEVSRDMPTTVVAACTNDESAGTVQRVFSGPSFRVYRSEDIIGVELAGSLKNVIAIATGILDGLNLGDNTKGALMTRGLAEITRLGEAMGAQPRTFAGLAGMGDLITTCISKHSRNRHVGEHIGKGQFLDEVLEGMTMVAEGVPTCRSAKALSQKFGVSMPITEEVFEVLFHQKSPVQAMQDLMTDRKSVV